MPSARSAVASEAQSRHPHSRVRRTVSRYRDACHVLRTPASARSRHGLDWTNFFIADIQTGFGTFVAFYLASLGWSQGSVGLALGVGGIAGVLAQIPGGALADAVRAKRALVATGVVMLACAALTLALASNRVLLFGAEVMHGLASGLVTPAIAAISLGLVGRSAMSLRTGRNFRFSAAGTVVTASLLGAIGSFVSPGAIFLAAAALCIPALVGLSFIRGDEIDYARARNAAAGADADKLHRVVDLARNRELLLFAGCLVLFQFANASMLPLVSESVAASKAARAPILISGLIVAPQVLVAILSPWVGYHSEQRGRKPLLLIGLGVETIRAAAFAFATSYPWLFAIQMLDGIGGAIVGVIGVLVITDLTAGTGRFNLAQGTIGAMTGLAAAASTGATGFVSESLGRGPAFLVIAGVAAAATAAAWMFLPETKPEKY